MTSGQILFYGVVLLLVLLYVRRYFRMRSIKQYSPGEVRERMQDRSVVLLDVRTDAERRAQTIRGSLHLPLQHLAARVQELEGYRSKEIICYCRSGNRSLSAALLLRKHGFNAGNLKGGLAEWNLAGLRERQ
jgi:rhodanese-related sulfurtransferase